MSGIKEESFMDDDMDLKDDVNMSIMDDNKIKCQKYLNYIPIKCCFGDTNHLSKINNDSYNLIISQTSFNNKYNFIELFKCKINNNNNIDLIQDNITLNTTNMVNNIEFIDINNFYISTINGNTKLIELNNNKFNVKLSNKLNNKSPITSLSINKIKNKIVYSDESGYIYLNDLYNKNKGKASYVGINICVYICKNIWIYCNICYDII